jgi:hypothetical protein
MSHDNSHMLRHSCGYKQANDGHDTRLDGALNGAGARSVQGFWKD